jgi:endoglucanase
MDWSERVSGGGRSRRVRPSRRSVDGHEFYPENTWRDDMEFGAAEIALAARKPGHDASSSLSDTATWAKGYLANETGDTLNLYDTSALAHADLAQAMTNAGDPSGLAVKSPPNGHPPAPNQLLTGGTSP